MAKLASRSWTDEETYWRENYKTRPYAGQGQNYESFGPAYRFGYDAYERYPDKSWDDVESDLGRDWDSYENRGQSTWQQMKNAVKDAWDRVTGNR
jgi:hypothetical protein